MYEQLPIPIPETIVKRKTYILRLYYGNSYCGTVEVRAYNARHAKYLFYRRDSRNEQYTVTDCYAID